MKLRWYIVTKYITKAKTKAHIGRIVIYLIPAILSEFYYENGANFKKLIKI